MNFSIIFMKKHDDSIKKENIKKAVDYIRKTKKHGYAEHSIKKKLIEHDYDEKLVEHAFKHVNLHKAKSIFLRVLLFLCVIVAAFSLLKAFRIL